MKKILIIVTLLMLLFSSYKYQKRIIPEEAIRFRVLAHSNLEEDQNFKQVLVEKIEEEKLLNINFTSKEETSNYIKKNIPRFEQVINATMNKENYYKPFQIDYGKNYFPEKEYNDIIYEEGDYESLIITLGDGKGDNFWCVLFPSICFTEKEDVEYKSFIKEIFKKYF